MMGRFGHCTSAAAVACIALTAPGVAQDRVALTHYNLRGAGDSRVELGKSLAELSGLAFGPNGRLLGHGDEQAVIWQIDPSDGSSTEGLVLTGTRGVLQGDFEDIQVVGDRLYLVTSTGDVLETQARVGTRTKPRMITSGLKGVCSVEGMAWDDSSRRLLLLCKQTRSKRWHDDVVILGIHPETGRIDERPRIVVREPDLRRVTGARHFNGTAIARHPTTGTYILLAGPQHAYAEVGPDGRVLSGGRLDPERHRQPESIAIAPDLTLLIGDEAAGKTATITTYAWHP